MKRLLLVGAGHSHARVLLDMAGRMDADVEVTLVSPDTLAPYSGMVPGWMAGHYRWDECCIDFAELCRRAGARFRVDSATSIDLDACSLRLASRATLNYDFLSLDIGSTARPPYSDRVSVLPMRPLGALKERWESFRVQVAMLPPGVRFRVVVVGGGAAGAESMLAVRHQLAQWAPYVPFEYVLATQGSVLLPQLAAGAGQTIAAHLQRHGVRVAYGFEAERIESNGVVGKDGRTLGADLVLWAAGARAHDWPAASGLAHRDGFIAVDSQLCSVSHPNVFAAGDCASFEEPLPKAGVFAVRMGPILSDNLLATLHGAPLRAFIPQRRHLALLGTGGPEAVAAWGPLSFQGRWVWRWKQFLDQRFIHRYHFSPIRGA